MATWSLTFFPIKEVLLNGGEIKFSKLVEILTGRYPDRFRSMSVVEHAIDNLISCLQNDGGIVRFNKEACNYACPADIDRSIQHALYTDIPNMESWQLYPFLTRENSKQCYCGIPWQEIPKDRYFDKEKQPFDDTCDWRYDGTDSCSFSCGVSQEVLDKYLK